VSNLYRTARLTNDISALDRRSGAHPRWFLAAAVGSLTGGLVNGKGDGPVRRGICNRPDPPQLARGEHLGHSDWIYQGAGARCERDRRGAPRLDLWGALRRRPGPSGM